MKAAVLNQLHGALTLVSIDKIPELGVGHVLVDVKVAGICGAQLLEINGYKGNEKFLPHMMGHEGGGVVREVGPGVTKVKPGDRVVMHWRKGSGIEAPFVKYGNIGAGKVTTFSDQSIVSENRVTKISNDAPYELCALLGCGVTTAFGVINNDAKVKMGESVLVLGCGGVGLSVIKGASLAGAAPVGGYDIEDKTELVNSHGGHNFYDDWMSISHAWDVIIDTVGSSRLFGEAIDKLASGGRYVLVGQPKPDTFLPIKNALSMFDGTGKTIIATQGGQTNPDVDIHRYYRMYNNGLFDYTNLVTHRFELDDVNEGIKILESGSAGRILLDIC